MKALFLSAVDDDTSFLNDVTVTPEITDDSLIDPYEGTTTYAPSVATTSPVSGPTTVVNTGGPAASANPFAGFFQGLGSFLNTQANAQGQAAPAPTPSSYAGQQQAATGTSGSSTGTSLLSNPVVWIAGGVVGFILLLSAMPDGSSAPRN